MGDPSHTADVALGGIDRPGCCVLPEADSDKLGNYLSLQDGTWIRLGIALVLVGQSMVWGLAVNLTTLEPFSPVYWGLHGILVLSVLVVTVLLGIPLFRAAGRSMIGRRFNLETLFALSLGGAIGGSLQSTVTGTGAVYYEVVVVVLVIYTLGQKLGMISRERAFVEMTRFREQFATAIRLGPDGSETKTPFSEFDEGDWVRVYPGRAIALDGVVLDGIGFVRETALTGEPHPVLKTAGEFLRAGTWSIDGTFTCQVKTPPGGRVIDRILEGVASSLSNTRSRRELQAERWIHRFVLIVAGVALLTGLYWSWRSSFSIGWMHSMAVLLVACPCALGLATPLAISTGIWHLASFGLHSRASFLLDALANTKHLFFDKTGTLTHASLEVGWVHLAPDCQWSRQEVLAIASHLESSVDHPIGRAFQRAGNSARSFEFKLSEIRWLPGKGVEGNLESKGQNQLVKLGSPAWVSLQEGKAPMSGLTTEGKEIWLSMDSKVIARMGLIESLRPGVSGLFQKLKHMGIRCTILTGDPHPQWEQVEGVAVRAGLTPEAKAAIVAQSASAGESPIFLGDGINDLDAMGVSVASIAMEDGGTALTQSSASAVLAGKDFGAILPAIGTARQIDQTLRGNLFIAAAYNTVGIGIAAAGLLHPVAAALIMVVSSLVVTFRAIRKSEQLRLT
jgi:heavy metal translocating P-type ATPase